MLGRMGDKRDKQTLKSSIEENLRKVYQEMMDEDVPDRFKQLLAELRQTQGAAVADPARDDGEAAE